MGPAPCRGRGVRAAESGEEEAKPAWARGGCRQGLRISWLRRIHGELHAGLSLSDYPSREGGSGMRQEPEGKGEGRSGQKVGKEGRGAGRKGGSRGEPPALATMGARMGWWGQGGEGRNGMEGVERGWEHQEPPQSPPGRGLGWVPSHGASTACHKQLSAKVRGERPHLLPVNYS